jgi:outer membrane protein TolC
MRKTLFLLFSGCLWAQEPLSLRDAVRLAIHENKAIGATAAGVEASQARITEARGGRLPQVSFRAGFEADRQRFVTRGGANWMASVSLRWNLFNGFADKSRIAENTHLWRRAESAVKLQVRQSSAGLEAAQQRIDVAGAAVAGGGEPVHRAEPLRGRHDQRDGAANVRDCEKIGWQAKAPNAT